MVEKLDRSWWSAYRQQPQKLFQQDEIVLRAHTFEPL